MSGLAIWIRPPTYPRWCRLLGVGSLSMRTACHAPISASEAVQIAHAPPECDCCRACRAEIAKRPIIAVIFDVEDLDADDDLAIARETTADLRGPVVLSLEAIKEWR